MYGYKNHDEKLSRRVGRGEASKKTVQALNVSFQVKCEDFSDSWVSPYSYGFANKVAEYRRTVYLFGLNQRGQEIKNRNSTELRLIL